MSKPTFTTQKSKDRIQKIITLCSTTPMTLIDLAEGVGAARGSVWHFVIHMLDRGMLKRVGKDEVSAYTYMSTGVGIYDGPDCDEHARDERRTKAVGVKPFADAKALPREFFRSTTCIGEQDGTGRSVTDDFPG